ncbi:hypothetical protein [Paenibacillus sp. NPDC058071]|uniref:hypothetical protein n=1 Tax=Paenibacillus sp. NPDC058071 TaxID=3346326 RepID=UPI0036DD4C4C
MWMWISIIVVWFWAGYADIPLLAREQRWKGLVVQVILLLLFTASSILQMYTAVLPNPLKWIGIVISPYVNAFYRLLS